LVTRVVLRYFDFNFWKEKSSAWLNSKKDLSEERSRCRRDKAGKNDGRKDM